MGGGGEHHHVEGAHGHDGGDFRSKVWSLTGGPNCRPKHWKRNTAFAMCGIVLICIPIAMKSAELEGTPDVILYLMGFREICGSLLIVTGGCVWELVDVVCVLTSADATFTLFSVSPVKIVFHLNLEICHTLGFTEMPLIKQRPHLPVRPIPSQIWCKNFGNKDY